MLGFEFQSKKWFVRIGFQYSEVFKSTLKDHERVAVLQFPAVEVKKVMEYDHLTPWN